MATSGCCERDGPRCRARCGKAYSRLLHRRVRLKREFDGPHHLTEDTLPQAVSAARDGDVDTLAAVLARSPEVVSTIGADVNANPFRGTPLLWACYSDKVDAATWLLDHGADPDLRHDWGGEGHGVDAVAMHLAAQHNCVGCLNLLLDRGADPTIVDGAHGGTPAGWAEYGGAFEALEILKPRGT